MMRLDHAMFPGPVTDPVYCQPTEDARETFIEHRAAEILAEPVELWRALASYAEAHETKVGMLLITGDMALLKDTLKKAVDEQCVREWNAQEDD